VIDIYATLSKAIHISISGELSFPFRALPPSASLLRSYSPQFWASRWISQWPQHEWRQRLHCTKFSNSPRPFQAAARIHRLELEQAFPGHLNLTVGDLRIPKPRKELCMGYYHSTIPITEFPYTKLLNFSNQTNLCQNRYYNISISNSQEKT